jgi:hypothetical protein
MRGVSDERPGTDPADGETAEAPGGQHQLDALALSDDEKLVCPWAPGLRGG